ncbi:hypothetical protein TL16_g06337 [Triparma laevis f. inornata]|uniref:Uncharacterized protein n=1 Tax=Triparma laevis f. inornata TaxID=1714386 RepID=A0A9W7AKK1_9STRA|nr:hypothetical protein TL16_g06337 [Triparma laevis f. inornata]
MSSSSSSTSVPYPRIPPPPPLKLFLTTQEHGKPPRSTFSYPPKSLSTLISSTFTHRLKSYTSSHSSTQSHKLGHRLHPDETLQKKASTLLNHLFNQTRDSLTSNDTLPPDPSRTSRPSISSTPPMSPELTSHSNLHSSPSHLSLRSLTYDLSSSPSRGTITNSFDEPEITHNLDSTPQIKITKNDAIEYLYSLPSKLISSLLHPSILFKLSINQENGESLEGELKEGERYRLARFGVRVGSVFFVSSVVKVGWGCFSISLALPLKTNIEAYSKILDKLILKITLEELHQQYISLSKTVFDKVLEEVMVENKRILKGEEEEERVLTEGEEEEVVRRIVGWEGMGTPEERIASNLARDLIGVYEGLTSEEELSDEEDDTHYPGYEDGYVYGRSVGGESLGRGGGRRVRVEEVLEGRGRKVKGIANRHWVDLRLVPPPVKNKLRPYHALIFPNFSRADILSSSTTLPGHLIKLVKHCSPVKSLEGVAVDAMISKEMALEGAEYLRDRGVCVGVRRVGLDSRFVVRRRGGPLKIPALSEAFIEKFKGVCCAGAQHQGQGVPPIHVVVAELTAPRVCLGDVLRGITNLNSGKIILKGRGSEGLEEDGCRGLSEGWTFGSPRLTSKTSDGSSRDRGNSNISKDSHKDSPDNRMFALSRSMESPVRISGALSSALAQWGAHDKEDGVRGRGSSPPPFMLSKNESEESPKRSGLSFVEDNDSDSDMDEEDVFVDAVTGLKTSHTVKAVTEAQAVLMDMLIWLRGENVITELLGYVVEAGVEVGEEEDHMVDMGDDLQPRMVENLEALREAQEGNTFDGSLSLDEAIYMLKFSNEEATNFFDWGIREKKFAVDWRVFGQKQVKYAYVNNDNE